MRYIVDRIEDNYAVLEDENKSIINIKLESLPNDIKEGNIIDYIDNNYILNKDVEVDRKNLIINKMNNIWDD